MEQWSTKRIIVLTLTVGTVLYLVYYVPGAVAHFVGRIWDLVVILILATALAVLLAPAVDLLCRLRVAQRISERTRRMLATLLVMLALVWVGGRMASLTASQMLHEISGIADIGKTWLATAPTDLQVWLAEHADQMPPGFVEKATEAVAQWTQGVLQYQFGFAKGALLQGWYLVELLIIPVLSFYFLVDSRPLREGLLYFTPSQHRAFANAVIGDVAALLHNYVRAQVMLCALKGVLVGLILYFCGVKMYLTLAIIAATFRMAPVVGPLVAGIPCVGIPLIQNGLSTGIIVLSLYAVLIFIDGKLLTPITLAESATLHPVIVIISLLLGYEFMGVLGLLIAVPVAGIIRAVYVRYHETYVEAATGSADAEEQAPANQGG